MLCRWGGDDERTGRREGNSGGSSSDEEDEGKLSRAEELRQQRLSTLVKRNLTGILLEVTDAMIGELVPLVPEKAHLAGIVPDCEQCKLYGQLALGRVQ